MPRLSTSRSGDQTRRGRQLPRAPRYGRSRPTLTLPRLRASRPVAEAAEASSALGTPQRRLRTPRAWMVLLPVDAAALLLPAALPTERGYGSFALALVTLVLLQSGRLYQPRLKLSVLDDAPQLFVRLLVAVTLVGVGLVLLGRSTHQPIFLALAGLALVLLLLGRVLSYAAVRHQRRSGKVSHPTIVVGGGRVANHIVERLVADGSYGLTPIGFLDRRPFSQQLSDGVSLLGGAQDLVQHIRSTGARVIIIAFSGEPESELVDVLRACERSGCTVFVVPRLFEIHNYGQTDHIGGIAVVRLLPPRLNTLSWEVKRASDIVASSVGLLVLSPLLALVGLAVRLEGGPGIIFRQTRVGLDGREFELMKFRSLRPLDDKESQTRWDVSDDDRLGPAGRFIRRTSIDELPQLLNVLRGEMTLVGPRPERPHFTQQFTAQIPDYRHRQRVPAGLTGLAQVSGLRGDTSIVDRARYDNFYIQNWSLWLDVKILCATIAEVLGAKGR